MSTGPGHGDQDPIEMRQCNAASLLHVLQQSYGSYKRSNSYHAVTIVQDRYRKRRGDPEEL